MNNKKERIIVVKKIKAENLILREFVCGVLVKTNYKNNIT